MGSRKIGAGFIGCGGHACGSNIPDAAKNPDIELTAFCDIRPEQLDMLKKQYSPKLVTTEMEEVFAHPGVGMVICATKPGCRIPVMKLAARHRKPLFVEKPMAYTREDLMEMCMIMKGADIPFVAGYNRVYSPMMQAVKPVFRKHKKGNTTIIYRIVGESSVWPPEHRHDVLEKGEYTVIHEATHIFDLINWLTDSRPLRVYMSGGGNVDNVITLDYPEDVTAVVISGDNGSAGYPKERLEINTACGTIVGDYFVEMTVAGMGGSFERQIFPYVFKGKTFNDGFEGVKAKIMEWRAGLTEEKRAVGHYFGQTPCVDKGHYAHQEHFREMAVSGEASPGQVAKAAEPNLIAWAAIESLKNKQPVEIDYSMIDSTLGSKLCGEKICLNA